MLMALAMTRQLVSMKCSHRHWVQKQSVGVAISSNDGDRFHSALHEPLFQVCSYLDPRFKATYERSSVVIDEVKKK